MFFLPLTFFYHQQVLPCTRQIMRKGAHRVWTRFFFKVINWKRERTVVWRKILRSHGSWKRSHATSQISLCRLISDCHTLHNQIQSLLQIHGVWVKGRSSLENNLSQWINPFIHLVYWILYHKGLLHVWVSGKNKWSMSSSVSHDKTKQLSHDVWVTCDIVSCTSY